MPRPNLKAPPKWRLKQLELARAIHVGRVKPSDLTNELSPLLKRDRWEVEDNEYQLLLPSLRLASLWIEVGMPYIARFLPSDRLHEEMFSKATEDIPSCEALTIGDIKTTRSELAEVAKSTRWQIDRDMRTNNGWLGITRTTPQPRPWYPTPPEDVVKYDRIAQKNGAKRRPLIVGIMGEYVRALNVYKDTDERHLRAAFMAAYTITHEVGHVIWWQDFRSYDSELAEPYVMDDCWKELGFAFGSWIFNGYNPVSAELPGQNWYEFGSHCYWEEHRNSKSKLTPWKSIYSISMKFMESCFTKAFWDKCGPVGSADFSTAARRALTLNLQSAPKPAMAMEIQFGNWEDCVEDGDEECEDDEEDHEEGNKGIVKLAWKRKPYDRSQWGSSKVWDWLTPEDRLWVQGRGSRVIHPSTGVETTGDIGQQKKAEAKRRQGDKNPETETPINVQFPKPNREENPDFESQIEASVLGQDVPLSPQQLETPKYQKLVRIRVTHHPLVPVTAPLKSAFASFNRKKSGRRVYFEDDSSEQPSKKLKLYQIAIEDEVEEKLDLWSVRNIERTFTHRKAFDWCRRYRIDFGDFFDNAQWQLQPLDYAQNTDKYLIERMRYFVLTREMNKYLGGSQDEVKALLRLKRELKDSVQNWGPKACKHHCEVNGLEKDGSREDVLARIKKWYERDIAETLLYQEDPDEESFEDVSLQDDISPEATDDEINAFIARNGLKKWGSAKCKRERCNRFRYLRDTGAYPSRSSIASRTFRGAETYHFLCNLHSSTVGELRSALFVEGKFPHNAELKIQRDFKDHGPLNEDGNTLAAAIPYYGESVLQLQLTSNYSLSPEGFAGDIASTSEYQPRECGSTITGHIDPGLQRKADIMSGRAVPTLGERLRQVHEFRAAFDKAMTVDGGRDVLRPHRQGIRSTSGAEILDNLEEVIEARRQFVAAVGAAEGVDDGPKEEEDDEPATGISHMADLFRKI